MTESRIIGERFELEGLLGQGGMAAVFKGTDTMTGQAVAIKRLKPEVIALDPDIVERFAREGEALRRLNHPNIVKVLGTAEEEDGHYVVMELVSGGDLRSMLDNLRSAEEQMPVQRVMEIALDLSDALTRAHRLKIVHRDLKPANVLLAEDGTPRLTDFGVAHFSDSTRMTQTGAMVGTLSYLSPEICMGEDADSRTDIWSFGVMIYEMLTLQRPFAADNSAALINNIISRVPRPVTELRPDCPPELNALVMRMLVKDRDQRISSVRSVGAQLEAMLLGQPVPEDTPTPVDTQRWPQVPPDVDTGEFLPGEKAESRDRERTVTPAGASFPGEVARRDTEGSRPSSGTGTGVLRDTLATSTRILKRQPRVFISYRRSDSPAIVGRLYDRLVAALGKENVFKDVDDIPLGVDFKQVLDSEVGRADVLLVIIGPTWEQAADTNNQRRLDDPNDFVRIEVAAALAREDVLIVPVLVGGATMPPMESLPPEIQGMAYRNAATVRNDPDFNRDVEWLLNQINGSVQAQRGGPRLPLWLAGVMALLALVVLALVVIGGGESDTQDNSDALPATVVADNVPAAVQLDPAAITVVDPVPEGNLMVLVAEFERVGGEPRDVSSQIAEDLQTRFEEDVPFSSMSIRQTPDVVRSEDDVLLVAEANSAVMVIWGAYDADVIDVFVSVGSLAVYPQSVYSRDELARLLNVQLTMTNPRRESVIAPVVAMANLIASAASDPWIVGQNLTALDVAAPVSPQVVGNGAPENWHRYIINYFGDAEEALADVEQAIALDPHPLYYLGLTLAYQRTGQSELVAETTRTAALLGPEDWAMPDITEGQYLLYFESDYEGALELLNRAAENGGTDWYLNTLRGAIYFLQDDLDAARPLLEAAVAADQPLNWPYALASTLALREGRVLDASALIQAAEDRLVNPDYEMLVLTTAYGEPEIDNAIVKALESFSTMILRQWRATVAVTEDALAQEGAVPDLYLMQGIAYCNLEEYAAAEASYTALLERYPDYEIAYSLRAESRLRQGKDDEAEADFDVLRAGEINPQIRLSLPLVEAGVVTCENLLDFDPGALGQGSDE